MVKRYPLLVLGLLSTLFAEAQIVIPKVGVTYSKAIRYTPDSDFLSYQNIFKPGLLAGIAIEIPVEKMNSFYFQAELIYIQKGHKLEEKSTSGAAYMRTEDYRLEFIEIPLLVKWGLVDRRINLYLQTGVTAAYALRGYVRSKMEMEYQSAWIRATSDREIQFGPSDEEHPNRLYVNKSIDVGLQLGLGALVLNTVQVEARFTHGLIPFEYASSNYRGYNRSLQISAGIPFNVGAKQFRRKNQFAN